MEQYKFCRYIWNATNAVYDQHLFSLNVVLFDVMKYYVLHDTYKNNVDHPSPHEWEKCLQDIENLLCNLHVDQRFVSCTW